MSNLTDFEVMKHLLVNMDDEDVHTLFGRAFEILLNKNAVLLDVLEDAGCLSYKDNQLVINYEMLEQFFEQNTGSNGEPIRYVKDNNPLYLVPNSNTINWDCYLNNKKIGEVEFSYFCYQKLSTKEFLYLIFDYF